MVRLSRFHTNDPYLNKNNELTKLAHMYYPSLETKKRKLGHSERWTQSPSQCQWWWDRINLPDYDLSFSEVGPTPEPIDMHRVLVSLYLSLHHETSAPPPIVNIDAAVNLTMMRFNSWIRCSSEAPVLKHLPRLAYLQQTCPHLETSCATSHAVPRHEVLFDGPRLHSLLVRITVLTVNSSNAFDWIDKNSFPSF